MTIPRGYAILSAMHTLLLVAGLVLLLVVQLAAAGGAEQSEFIHVTVDPDGPRDPHCKGAGDIDGDGHVDLLAASASGGGLWWYCYPDWSKHRIADGSFTTSMAVGDVDGNGHADVVIPSGAGLMWYRNPAGAGGDPKSDAWESRNLGRAGANIHDVRLADLTGNGRLDVIGRHQSGFGRRAGNAIHLWIQGDDGQWAHRQFPCPHGEGLAVADLTGNGRPNIIIGGRWYENDGDPLGGEWREHRYIDDETFAAGWTNGDNCVAAADLNGNGRIDIALSPAEGRGRLSWFEAPEDPRQGPWREHVIDQTDHMHSLSAADMNGNGRVDLITAKMHQATEPREVAVWYNQGRGNDWAKQVLSTRGSHSMQVLPWAGGERLAIFGANWNSGSPTRGALELWMPASSENAAADNFRVLIYSRTTGFRHGSIPAGIRAIRELGEANGFAIDATEDPSAFTDENLGRFAAVIFLNTTGNVLDDEQKRAFERYIRAGNGYVGVHSAADTEYDWEWYGRLVGAYFKSHPRIQPATLIVEDREHPATRHLPQRWQFTDEWYVFRSNPRENVNVLITLDEDSYDPGEAMGDHPIAWYHEYDGGRAFYTGLGHRNETFADEHFRRHLLGGILYAAGQRVEGR